MNKLIPAFLICLVIAVPSAQANWLTKGVGGIVKAPFKAFYAAGHQLRVVHDLAAAGGGSGYYQSSGLMYQNHNPTLIIPLGGGLYQAQPQ